MLVLVAGLLVLRLMGAMMEEEVMVRTVLVVRAVATVVLLVVAVVGIIRKASSSKWTGGARIGLLKNTAMDPEVSIQKEGLLELFGLSSSGSVIFLTVFIPNC